MDRKDEGSCKFE